MNRAKAAKKSEIIDQELIDEVVLSLNTGQGIRKDLAQKGRLNIDRPLPFLCVYRRPVEREDSGTAHLIMGEASYLIASGNAESEDGLRSLIKNTAKALADKFGAVLIIEVWSALDEDGSGFNSTDSKAKFKIFTDKAKELPSTIDTFEKSLEALEIRQEVTVVIQKDLSPPGLPALLDDKTIRELSCLVVGLEISPVFRDNQTGGIYLSILSDLRRKFSTALQQTFFEFVQIQTPERPTRPQMLGRRVVVDAVWTADAELSELSDTFNYLMAVTPVNADEAFEHFRDDVYERDPLFHYRLLTIDPENLKRRLYSISFDEIEDPTIAYLLRDKRIELDRQITLIEDRNTHRFLYESLQLFPPVEDELMSLAETILNSPKKALDTSEKLSADEVADLARIEIEYYRNTYPAMDATVEIRKDTPPGLMVSHGNLLIGKSTKITSARINALLQHEIGTHSVTYHNGRAQPLKLLYSGLPGYEQLQEGLAVFAEYLSGGLNFNRLRILAARVVAVRRLTLGSTFTEVFNELRHDHKFTERTAFNIAMRVFRGGGLTKDAVYLRGLVEVLNYLRAGGDIETLFVGKMGPEHVSIIRELQWREVLRPAPLMPRYMAFPETAERLQRVKEKVSILDLI
ncbi:MAG: flavohemoglobin expression-modulating QEGLA motif protein [Pyrinomonadaceae bacterium]